MFVCDDDLLRPKALERAVQILDDRPDVAFVHSAFDIIDEHSTVLGSGVNQFRGSPFAGIGWAHDSGGDRVESGHEFIHESMIWGCRVCSSTGVFRIPGLPWPVYAPEAGVDADLLLWMRLALGSNVYFSSHSDAAYRVHSESVSAASWGVWNSTFYQPKSSAIFQVRRVKLQFLRESAGRISGRAAMRYDVERASARALFNGFVRPKIPESVKRAVRVVIPKRRVAGPPPEEPSVP